MKNKYFYLIVFCCTILGIISCADDDPTDDAAKITYDAEISNISNNVILPTYKDLVNAAKIMNEAAKTLQSNKNEDNLAALRRSWIAARSPWELSEGFLFGPVDQEGIDPSIDSWPVNVIDLVAVLNSPNALTADFLSQQEGNLKGFHTIEYLVWGENGNKKIEEFTGREFEYLTASTEALSKDVQKINELWSQSGGNYINEVLLAGKGSKVYPSQKAVIDELVTALAGIADEVGNGKINDPLSQNDPTLEESRFSGNSKADFADNIKSIQNIYLGNYNNLGNSKSISSIIKTKYPDLNFKIISQITKAISTIEAIPGTFTMALTHNKADIEEAQQQVRKLEDILNGELIPAIADIVK